MNAQAQAIAQIESIVALVAALEVDYDRLEELREELEERQEDEGGCYSEFPAYLHGLAAAGDPDAIELAELEAQAGGCSSQDEAQDRIQEDPLSVEVRSGWVSMGETLEAEEFRIVLCTGGPHVEILGDLRNGSPSSVRVRYQGWGESGELFKFDRGAVLTYCQQFCFGE